MKKYITVLVFSARKTFIPQGNQMENKKILKSCQINLVLGGPHLGFAQRPPMVLRRFWALTGSDPHKSSTTNFVNP